jgi:phosphatidate cytidylyltransferase
LAPSISPNKTWEGLAFGVASAALVGLLMALFRYDIHAWWEGVVYGALLAVVGQCGDLFESWLKRRAGVKDSGTLIPGHGGALDRVDAIVFAAPVYALLVLI